MDKVKELAKMIDHSLLHPTMTDKDLVEGCELARYYDVASVCIKPYYVKQAAELLKGSDVLVCTVIGFPHGSSTTENKIAETVQACKEGATEIDMVVNIGKVLSADWDYVSSEIIAIHNKCKEWNAILKVIFENDFLPGDEPKIKLCEICSNAGVEFVKTSTGYGFVKGADGKYSYEGATDKDLILMRKHSAPSVQIKAAGGIRSLDGLLRVKALGVTRIGATATAAMLEDAKKLYGADTDTAPGFAEAKGY